MRTSQILFIFFIFSGFLFAQNNIDLAVKFRLELSDPKDSIKHASFAPDGERILLVGKRSTQVGSARTGKLLLNFTENTAYNNTVAIKWQPNGSKLLVFDRGGGKRSPALLFDAATGKQIAVLQGKKKAVHQADWSPDGKRIFTLNMKKDQLDPVELSVWTENGELINSVFYESTLRKPVFIDGGRKLLFDRGYSPYEKPIVIWDIERGQTVNSFDQPYKKRDDWNHAELIAVSPDERLVCGYYGISEGMICWETGDDGPVKFAFKDTKETGDHYFCGFNSDGKRFAILKSKQNKVEFIDSITGEVEYSIESPNSAGCASAGNSTAFSSWSPNDTFFITHNDDDKLSMWEVATGRRTGSFKLIDRRSIADPNLDTDVLSFNPSKPILMSVSNKLLRLWDLQTGELIRKLEKDEIGERLQIRLADWGPDGSLLITGSKNDNAVLIWEVLSK